MLNYTELKQLFQSPLPGVSSQLKMAPDSRAVQLAQFSDKMHLARQSAVMILLFPHRGELSTALIKRSEYNGFHSGQIAFPGGKHEETDDSFETTALRETFEEIGVDPNQIEVLGQLTDLFIPPSNFLIQVFVGYCDKTPTFRPNTREVQAVITVALSELSDRDKISEKDFYAGALNQTIAAPFYKINELEIWGATAMIISELVDFINTKTPIQKERT